MGGTPLEVEAKVAVADPAPLREALRRLGAKASPAVTEEDVFFAHPARDLVAADEALRLRRAGDGFELTYKGARQAGAVKSREERTVRLADDPTALLAALGFRATVRLRKQRERFRFGTLEVTLDHVEGLGWFAEVEALGDDRRAAQAQVEAGLRELGLAGLPREERAYIALALAAGAQAATRL